MLILTNALSDTPDEGCLQVAANLIPELQARGAEVMSCAHLTGIAGRLLLDRELLVSLRKRTDSVLYLPFPAKPIAAAARIFVLARCSGRPVNALLVMMGKMGPLSKFLLRSSGTHITVLSRQAQLRYSAFLPENRVHRLKTGVNPERFVPVSPEQARALKGQFGFDPQRPLILHVGHLKAGRGLDNLMQIDSGYQVLLVTSTLTRAEQDAALRRRLLECGNIRIWDTYIPDMVPVYQMCDAYFFPVRESGNCIDVPLSCLEAAACGKPVITTAYGEMAEFMEKPGFYRLDAENGETISRIIARALGDSGAREAVLDYGWKQAAGALLEQERCLR